MKKNPETRPRMTLDEYFEWEARQPIKYEYVAGEVYAMTGASRRHVLITLNIVRALHAATRRRRCDVLANDMKVQLDDRVYYPDVVVDCSKTDGADEVVHGPSLIAEVTSPSTRKTDRREKLDTYLKLPSLRVYLIVAQRHRHVIAYIRAARDGWIRTEHEGHDAISVAFLETRLSLDQIYEGVALPPLTVKEGAEKEEDWKDMAEIGAGAATAAGG